MSKVNSNLTKKEFVNSIKEVFKNSDILPYSAICKTEHILIPNIDILGNLNGIETGILLVKLTDGVIAIWCSEILGSKDLKVQCVENNYTFDFCKEGYLESIEVLVGKFLTFIGE